MLADLRDALRQLRKAPGVTATAVITLALGIGATTAIFTLVHQVMLKSLPVTKPEELWRIGDKVRCCNWGGYTQGDDGDFSLFSWEAYKNFRAHTPEFTDLAALQAGNAPLGVRRAGSQAQADTRNGEYVSGNFFRTFGVQPWIGRLMTDADDQEGAPPVAVMSYRIWQEKYGSDPSVVGASYQINGHPFTVIGVARAGILWSEAGGLGHAGFLAAADHGTADRRRHGAAEKAERQLPGPDRKSASGSESEVARSQAEGGIPRLAGQPRAGYGAGREAALAAADAAPDSRRRGRGGHAGSISGWAEAAADRRRMRAAGGLREPGESDAGARVEGSRADVRTRGAGCVASAPGAQGVGGVACCWR